MKAQKPLRLGIAGLGTVGSGLLSLLHEHGEAIAQRCTRRVVVAGVSARSRTKQRAALLEGLAWFDDPAVLAADPAIDVFVELIGGDGGPALKSVEAALAAGKHVVTANKALLASSSSQRLTRSLASGQQACKNNADPSAG